MPVGARDVFTVLGELRKLQAKIQNAELNNLIADLMIEAADLKNENANLRTELSEFKDKVRDLEGHGLADMDTTAKKLENGYIFEGSEEVYCPKCYEGERKKHTSHYTGSAHTIRECVVCGAEWPTGKELGRTVRFARI